MGSSKPPPIIFASDRERRKPMSPQKGEVIPSPLRHTGDVLGRESHTSKRVVNVSPDTTVRAYVASPAPPRGREKYAPPTRSPQHQAMSRQPRPVQANAFGELIRKVNSEYDMTDHRREISEVAQRLDRMDTSLFTLGEVIKDPYPSHTW